MQTASSKKMKQYQDLLRHIRDNGTLKEDRTGTGTTSVFGHQMRFDLSKGFPCITTKKLHLRSIIIELLWFLQGDTNIKFLQENNVRIWDEWADENGNLGPVYGHQWRSWPDGNGGTIDQITKLVDQIKNNPDSRRLLVSAWNVADVDSMALPPCHTMFQFYVANGKLSCQLYQRSADTFLDAHIYSNHLEQVELQLSRDPKPLPTMEINPNVKDIFSFKYEDFNLINYDPDPHIKGAVAV